MNFLFQTIEAFYYKQGWKHAAKGSLESSLSMKISISFHLFAHPNVFLLKPRLPCSFFRQNRGCVCTHASQCIRLSPSSSWWDECKTRCKPFFIHGGIGLTRKHLLMCPSACFIHLTPPIFVFMQCNTNSPFFSTLASFIVIFSFFSLFSLWFRKSLKSNK